MRKNKQKNKGTDKLNTLIQQVLSPPATDLLTSCHRENEAGAKGPTFLAGKDQDSSCDG